MHHISLIASTAAANEQSIEVVIHSQSEENKCIYMMVLKYSKMVLMEGSHKATSLDGFQPLIPQTHQPLQLVPLQGGPSLDSKD